MKTKLVVWLLLAATLAIQGCSMNYLKRRFAKQADSTSVTVTVPVRVTVTDTVSIPRDSVVTTYRSDTLPFRRVVETDRTRLVIDRGANGQTTVQATSKPIYYEKTITVNTLKTIQAKCPPTAVFGVSKWWKWGFFAALVGIVAVAVFFTLKFYRLGLSLTPRSGYGTGTVL